MLAHISTNPETENDGLKVDADTFKRISEIHAKVSNTIIEGAQKSKKIMDRIRKAIDQGIPRLEVEITEFDAIWPGGAKMILNQPAIYLPAMNSAVKELFEIEIAPRRMEINTRLFRDPRISLKGWLRGNTITPRGLKASRINTVVAVEGIVTRCGVAKHQVVNSVYVTDKTLKLSKVNYRQDTIYSNNSLQIVPITDADGNRFTLETGLSVFQNYQTFTVQEMPENAPSGQLPCSVEVTVSGDLVDAIKAGDRVSVWGIYKAKMSKENNRLSGGARVWIEANNIVHLGGNQVKMVVDPPDMTLIRKLSKMPNLLEHLAHSIAPTLFGGLEKKKGLLLQLVGGTPKVLEDNTMRVRGDINILLVGDPSCGKSQMLRFMMQVAPLAISTTGRGSSGVGLTAAARVDEENKGERVLEAGAMVMADGGLVCIDEFDKMGNDDRTAIHEVMEQQTVSISKASIQTTLNARCSVLAAANPAYGCFDDTRDIRSQICFPDSLMSRFDLIFLVHESNTQAEDRKICRTVLANHINKASEHAIVASSGRATAGAFSGVVNRTDWTILPRDDPTHSNQNYDRQSPDGDVIYSISFLKKYIQIAKSKEPELTAEASKAISTYYTELRKRCVASQSHSTGKGKFAVPTARTLEAAIRLSTAHAKLCLKSETDVYDVLAAKQLLHYSLLGEEYEPEIFEEQPKPAKKQVDTQPSRKRIATPVEAATEIIAEKMGVKRPKKTAAKTPDRLSSVAKKPSATFDQSEKEAMLRAIVEIKDLGMDDMIAQGEFFKKVVLENGDRNIEMDRFLALLEQMVKENKIMMIEDSVWLI